MAPHGSLWLPISLCGPIRLPRALCGSLYRSLGPYGTLWLPLLPMVLDGSTWPHMAPSSSFLIEIDPYCSLQPLTVHNGSIWLNLAPIGSLWLPMTLNGSQCPCIQLSFIGNHWLSRLTFVSFCFYCLLFAHLALFLLLLAHFSSF
jgi:hypothetical protein